MDDERTLRWQSRLQAQAGVVSREQARDAGFTTKAIEWRLRSGSWQRLQLGVYATFTGPVSRAGALWGAVLRAGPGATLSHETAAELHKLVDKPAGQIHLSVPSGREPGRCGKIRDVTIHRSRRLTSKWQSPWRLPRTSVEDTVLDLITAARNFDDAYSWISLAVGRRRTTPRLLAKALEARSRMRWRSWVTSAIEDAADGVHSPLERHYVHGVERAHGLPAARRQAKRRHGSGARYLDNSYEPYRVCVELDGVAAHPAEGRWLDTRRDNVNLLQGTRTLRYGWVDATEHCCRTAGELGALLRRHGWKGTTQPCSPTCQASKVIVRDDTPDQGCPSTQ